MKVDFPGAAGLVAGDLVILRRRTRSFRRGLVCLVMTGMKLSWGSWISRLRVRLQRPCWDLYSQLMFGAVFGAEEDCSEVTPGEAEWGFVRVEGVVVR